MTTDEVKALVEPWITEAVALRRQCDLPTVGVPGAHEVRQALVTTRTCLDRIDELLLLAVRFRSSASRAAVAASAMADDAWDEAARRTPSVQYQSAREHAAMINLTTTSQLRQQRQATECLSVATEAHDVLKAVQRSTDGVRMDLHRMTTSLQFESNLDR